MAFLTDSRFRIDAPIFPRDVKHTSILVQFVVRKYNWFGGKSFASVATVAFSNGRVRPGLIQQSGIGSALFGGFARTVDCATNNPTVVTGACHVAKNLISFFHINGTGIQCTAVDRHVPRFQCPPRTQKTTRVLQHRLNDVERIFVGGFWVNFWYPINVLQTREEKQLVRRFLWHIRDGHVGCKSIKSFVALDVRNVQFGVFQPTVVIRW